MASVALLLSCATTREDLGHGYKVVREKTRSHSSFERYAYYDVLRYRHRSLGEIGEVSISPSGQYALFEQDGKLILFNSTAGSLTDVTDGPFTVPKRIEWKEPDGFVLITAAEGIEPRRIPLPTQ